MSKDNTELEEQIWQELTSLNVRTVNYDNEYVKHFVKGRKRVFANIKSIIKAHTDKAVKEALAKNTKGDQQ